MKSTVPKRFSTIVACLVLLVLVAAGSFAGGRWISRDREASAGVEGPTVTSTQQGGDPLGEEPDTSEPGWAVPYLETEAALPLMEGEIAGVQIGRLLDYGPLACPVARWGHEPEATRDTHLNIDVRGEFEASSPYQASLVGFCGDGSVAIAEADFNLAPGAPHSPLGGNIRVFRHTGQAVSSLSIPQLRWVETDVSGGPAAVATPILSEVGLGQGAVVTYRDGVLTLVHTWGVTYEGLIAVAEEVLQ